MVFILFVLNKGWIDWYLCYMKIKVTHHKLNKEFIKLLEFLYSKLPMEAWILTRYSPRFSNCFYYKLSQIWLYDKTIRLVAE